MFLRAVYLCENSAGKARACRSLGRGRLRHGGPCAHRERRLATASAIAGRPQTPSAALSLRWRAGLFLLVVKARTAECQTLAGRLSSEPFHRQARAQCPDRCPSQFCASATRVHCVTQAHVVDNRHRSLARTIRVVGCPMGCAGRAWRPTPGGAPRLRRRSISRFNVAPRVMGRRQAGERERWTRVTCEKLSAPGPRASVPAADF